MHSADILQAGEASKLLVYTKTVFFSDSTKHADQWPGFTLNTNLLVKCIPLP